MATSALTPAQRGLLSTALGNRLAGLELLRRSRLQGMSQADEARQTRDEEAGDETQRAGDHEVTAVLSDIHDAEFDAVASAMQRIHGMGYGVCLDCGEHIPYKRLSAEPEATRCAACETIHEGLV